MVSPAQAKVRAKYARAYCRPEYPVQDEDDIAEDIKASEHEICQRVLSCGTLETMEVGFHDLSSLADVFGWKPMKMPKQDWRYGLHGYDDE